MKKIMTALAIAVALMFSAACSSDSTPAPAVTVTATAQAPVSPVETQDEKYLSAIRGRASSLYSVPDADLVSLANQICSGLNSGISIERILQIGLDAGLDSTEVASIAAGAVVFYCPGADE